MASNIKKEFEEEDELMDYVDSVCADEDYVESNESEFECSHNETRKNEIMEGDACYVILPPNSSHSANNGGSNVDIFAKEKDSDIDNKNVKSDYQEIEIEEIKIEPDTSVYLSSASSEEPAAKSVLPHDAEPIEYFNLFFTPPLWDLLVMETNRYANNFLSSNNLTPHARAHMWHPVIATEMKAFVAVLLEMGITQRPTMFSYWTKNSRFIPWFSNMFSRNRFQLILKFLHVVDSETFYPVGHPEYNPCAYFKPLVDHANQHFKLKYAANKHCGNEQSQIGNKNYSMPNKFSPNDKKGKPKGAESKSDVDEVIFQTTVLSTHVAENEGTEKSQHWQKRGAKNYCSFIGDIYSSDLSIYSNLDERRSLKYWKKIVFCIFAKMVLNAYLVYKENVHGLVLTHVQFTSSVIESIEKEWFKERNKGSYVGETEDYSHMPQDKIGLRKLPGQRQRICVVCSRKNGGPVRKSRTVCLNCDRGLHGVCIVKHKC